MGRKLGSKNKPKTRGDANIRWIEEYCRIPEGADVGKPVKLREWQRAEIRKIYDNPAGTRRAIISFGRKNGKTALAAFLLLLHLCGREHRPNSQLYSAAQSRDQAALLFGLASKIVRMSPELNSAVIVRDTAKQLFCQELGTLYRALSAEASTAYGLSPIFIVHDELGVVKGERSELFEALETATGAQTNPLSLIISTQAPTENDLLSRLIDDALTGADPTKTVSIYTAPLEDDPFTEATIRKANPALGDFLNKTEVLAMAADAERMSSRESSFRNLILNQRVESSSPFISRTLWQECGAPPKQLGNVPVYAGLDLSSTSDLTAFVMIGQIDGIWHVHPTFWLPGTGLADKARMDRVPYDVWEKEGYLIAAPGKTVDYEYVAMWLRTCVEQYNIIKIAFDDWNFRHLKPWLLRSGFSDDEIATKFMEFRQGYKSMSPPVKDLEREIKNRRLAHGNHPVLSMCASNAVVEMDAHENIKLVKNKSPGRIDGMVALAMALGAAPSIEEKKPAFQMMFY